MNNKRILKKVINGACAEMFAEALAFSLYSGNVDEENAKSLLASIVNASFHLKMKIFKIMESSFSIFLRKNKNYII